MVVDSFHEDGKYSVRSTALKNAVSTCAVLSAFRRSEWAIPSDPGAVLLLPWRRRDTSPLVKAAHNLLLLAASASP